MVTGALCRERDSETAPGTGGESSGLTIGNGAAKHQALASLALSGLLFALEMSARLHSTRSQRILETFPRSNLFLR